LALLLLLLQALLVLLGALDLEGGSLLLVLGLLLRGKDAEDLLAQFLHALAIARASLGVRLRERVDQLCDLRLLRSRNAEVPEYPAELGLKGVDARRREVARPRLAWRARLLRLLLLLLRVVWRLGRLLRRSGQGQGERRGKSPRYQKVDRSHTPDSTAARQGRG
jgi:hypothetical protein